MKKGRGWKKQDRNAMERKLERKRQGRIQEMHRKGDF